MSLVLEVVDVVGLGVVFLLLPVGLGLCLLLAFCGLLLCVDGEVVVVVVVVDVASSSSPLSSVVAFLTTVASSSILSPFRHTSITVLPLDSVKITCKFQFKKFKESLVKDESLFLLVYLSVKDVVPEESLPLIAVGVPEDGVPVDFSLPEFSL